MEAKQTVAKMTTAEFPSNLQRTCFVRSLLLNNDNDVWVIPVSSQKKQKGCKLKDSFFIESFRL